MKITHITASQGMNGASQILGQYGSEKDAIASAAASLKIGTYPSITLYKAVKIIRAKEVPVEVEDIKDE